MPIPKPGKGEKEDKFVGRCMSNETMKREYPKNVQRFAVCMSSWRKAKGIKRKAEVLMFKLSRIIKNVEIIRKLTGQTKEDCGCQEKKFEYKGIVFSEAFQSLKSALDKAVAKRFGKDSYVQDFSNKEVIAVQYNVPGDERERFWKVGFKFKTGVVTLAASAQEVDLVTSYEQEITVSDLLDLVDIEVQLKGKDNEK
jgi:hypothetical protein